MEEAGIDIFIFKANSVRGASCSSATGAGVTTKAFLMPQTGHWKAPSSDFTAKILRENTKLLLALWLCHFIHLQAIHIDMNGAF